MIAEESIQSVKAVDILGVIGKYVILKRNGANYLGLCPFHEEHTPSFVVSPAKNRYKCFGCGKGGDSISFIMEYAGKSFIEAVEYIAGFENIQLSEAPSLQQFPIRSPKPRVSKVLADTIPLSLLQNVHKPNIYANQLTAQLAGIFGEVVISEVLQEYDITLNGEWITYPQIDYKGDCRTGKAIKYKSNGHRDSSAMPQWLHNQFIRQGLLQEDFKLQQCFTGEHVIGRYPHRPVAIVEGQSTMMFMACLAVASRCYKIEALSYFQDFTWICTGGADGIGWKTKGVTEPLRGKSCILFPDAGFFDKWYSDALQIEEEHGVQMAVSDLIEQEYKAGLLEKNSDLRDYFQQYTDDIKALCITNRIEIALEEVAAMPVDTKTKYGGLIMSTLWLKDGQIVDVLFSSEEALITSHPEIKSLEIFFNKSFQLATLGGVDCLMCINSETVKL